MKRFNKRLTSIVLALALLATLFAVPVFAEEPAAADVASYDRNAIELLNIVGITEVAQSDDLNTKVSRAEFAALLTRFVGNYNPTVADRRIAINTNRNCSQYGFRYERMRSKSSFVTFSNYLIS